MALLGFFDLIARTDAVATVMAHITVVEHQTANVVEKLSYFQAVCGSHRDDLRVLSETMQAVNEEMKSVQTENTRLKGVHARLFPYWQVECFVESNDDADTSELWPPGDHHGHRRPLPQQVRIEGGTGTPSAMDVAALARMGGLSRTFHQKGPVTEALARLAGSARLLAEAKAALTKEVEDLQPLIRQVGRLRSKVDRVQHKVVHMQMENQQLQIFCDRIEQLRNR